jgi:hypothetical protein
MIHIIDANNLAGKLGLLKKNNFDREIIEILKVYYFKKKIKVFLVFDGVDFMGNKFDEGFLTIFYTPRDNFYKSADDKIIEIVENLRYRDELSSQPVKDEIIVITDDLDIIEKLKNANVNFIKATDFAGNIKDIITEDDNIDDKHLSDEEIKKIDRELIKIWGNK